MEFLTEHLLGPESTWVEFLAAEGLLDTGETVRSPDGPAEAGEPPVRPSQPAEVGLASEQAMGPATSRAAAEPELAPDAAEQQRLVLLQQVAAVLERAFVQRPAPVVSAVGRPSVLPTTQELPPIAGCCCCQFLLLSSRTPDRDG